MRFQGHVLDSLVILTGGLGFRGALCCRLLAPHVPRMLPRLPCSLVHTVDTTRTTWTLEQMVKIKQPVLLVGESGTSKTATTQNFLKNLNEETNVSHCLFSLVTYDCVTDDAGASLILASHRFCGSGIWEGPLGVARAPAPC